MALWRFISRRNTPYTTILDNAPQFKLTKTTVDKAWQQSITHENVKTFKSDTGIKWKFIIQFSPWMGGFYKRSVGMVNSSLRKAIQRKFLTTVKFWTYATECEHILNSRPLAYINDDIRSTEAITPNHFLCLNPRNSARLLMMEIQILNNRWSQLTNYWKFGKKGKHICMNFGNIGIITICSVWGNDTKHSCKNQESNQEWIQWWDKIVHIKDAPRSKWGMGKIVQLIESLDEIRAASVLLPNGNNIGITLVDVLQN